MKYIAYYRVSTKRQKESRLSLESQRRSVLNYIKNNGNHIISEFTETESGANRNRPELLKAINLAKKEEAVIVIAKLDRLARDLHFVTTMMTEKTKFVAADMPEANELTIHILSAMAEYERKLISDRHKASYASRRARNPDVKFGRRKNGTLILTKEVQQRGMDAAHEAIRQRALTDENTLLALDFIQSRREKGLSYAKIAKLLNERPRYKTRTGKPFSAMQVHNIYKRFNKE